MSSSSQREARFQYRVWRLSKVVVVTGAPRPSNHTADLFREHFPPDRPEDWGTATRQQLEQLRDNDPCLRLTQRAAKATLRIELLKDREMGARFEQGTSDESPGLEQQHVGRSSQLPPLQPQPQPQHATEKRSLSGSETSETSFTTAHESSSEYEDALQEQVEEEDAGGGTDSTPTVT